MIAVLKNAQPRLKEYTFAQPVNWQINEGEQWAVIGKNGAGKSLLCNLLFGHYWLKSGTREFKYGDKISEWAKMITFNDLYTLPGTRNSYYQQRWNSTEIETVPTVLSVLGQQQNEEDLYNIAETFRLKTMLPKPTIALSCGEMRKFLIIKAIQTRPKLLILDNPFVGLDKTSRKELTNILDIIAQQKEITTILLVADVRDIPESVTHILPIKNRELMPPVGRKEFIQDKTTIKKLFDLTIDIEKETPPYIKDTLDTKEIFRLENVTIRYGEHMLLNNITWQINKGEHWALFGPNGSGKSTLLSLLCGDNPQAYAQKVFLFGKKRGTGESIWDIKRHIGYLSPEMQLYFNAPIPTVNIVASGFFDTMGLFREPNEQQRKAALDMMEYFGIRALEQKIFTQLSSGEQRLVLLCRTLVKMPDILILDEPLQGLDMQAKETARRIISNYIGEQKKTMIYVSHDIEELPISVDRIFVLPQGKVSMR